MNAPVDTFDTFPCSPYAHAGMAFMPNTCQTCPPTTNPQVKPCMQAIEPTGDAVTTPHPARRPAPTTIPPAYIVRAWNGGAEVACPYCHELHRHRRLPPPQRDRGYRTPPCQTHTGHSYRITRRTP